MTILRAGVLALALALTQTASTAVSAQTVADAVYHEIHRSTQEFSVPGGAAFMVCVGWKESGFDPWAVGDRGQAHGAWQFHRRTFATAARLAGYPESVATDFGWANDVEVSTRSAAALMASPRDGGVFHWAPARRCGAR